MPMPPELSLRGEAPGPKALSPASTQCRICRRVGVLPRYSTRMERGLMILLRPPYASLHELTGLTKLQNLFLDHSIGRLLVSVPIPCL